MGLLHKVLHAPGPGEASIRYNLGVALYHLSKVEGASERYGGTNFLAAAKGELYRSIEIARYLSLSLSLSRALARCICVCISLPVSASLCLCVCSPCLPHSLPPSLTHSLARSLAHLLTHSLTHSLTILPCVSVRRARRRLRSARDRWCSRCRSTWRRLTTSRGQNRQPARSTACAQTGTKSSADPTQYVVPLSVCIPLCLSVALWVT